MNTEVAFYSKHGLHGFCLDSAGVFISFSKYLLKTNPLDFCYTDPKEEQPQFHVVQVKRSGEFV